MFVARLQSLCCRLTCNSTTVWHLMPLRDYKKLQYKVCSVKESVRLLPPLNAVGPGNKNKFNCCCLFTFKNIELPF